MKVIIIIIEWCIYIPLALCVLYMFIFAISSHFKSKFKIANSNIQPQTRFLILFPAYKEDKVIIKSTQTFLAQSYPKYLFDIVVISDRMQQDTNEQLKQMGIEVLIANYENSTKAKALKLAMQTITPSLYDAVVIMDADNTAENTFLSRVNIIFSQGYKFIQAHRTNKQCKTDIALLDAVSEEINNGFFRKGHNAIGLSSALSGSGMIFCEKRFREYVMHLNTAGEDKELEALILKDKNNTIVFIHDLYVFDEKTSEREAISNQRKRWIAAQYSALYASLGYLTTALKEKNYNYIDKVIQWMFLPRLIQLGAVFSFALLFFVINKNSTILWLLLMLLQILAMFIPIPLSFYNKKLFKALLHVPSLCISMFFNLFKLKNASKVFIHTKHDSIQ